MHRELPDYVERMLQAPNAEETHSLVRRCNISDKKWNIFCCAFGGALKKRKQKDIAVDYGMSAARVSIIVKDVLTRLTRVVTEPNAPDVVLAYRKSRLAELKNINVCNARPVLELTKMFSEDKYHKCHSDIHLGWGCKVDFVVNGGEYLSIIGRSRLKGSRGFLEPTGYKSAYTIFWAERSDNTSKVSARILFDWGFNVGVFSGPARESLLLIDFNEEFWVVDRYAILDDLKHIVIYLKPAVIAPIATAH